MHVLLAIQHDEIVGALDALNALSALNALNVSWVVWWLECLERVDGDGCVVLDALSVLRFPRMP